MRHRIAGYVLAAIFSLVGTVIEWLQRRADPPIMRQRVNEGSDQFLTAQGLHLSPARRWVREFLMRMRL
jgi:hypothetical protein